MTSVFGIESEADDDARGIDLPEDKQEEKTADLRSAASAEPKKTGKKTKLPSQLAEEEKLVEQVKQRIAELDIGEMCASNGYNPETAATVTNRAFLAQSDKSIMDKFNDFKKQQEKEEAA